MSKYFSPRKVFINMRYLFTALIAVTILTTGCGTDVDSSYFVNLFSDPEDATEVAEALTEPPTIDGDVMTLKVSTKKLAELSTRTDEAELKGNELFQAIVQSPFKYVGKIVEIEAVLLETHGHHLPLYTGRQDVRFTLHTHGADIYTLDDDGEEQPLMAGRKYAVKCQIIEVSKHKDHLFLRIDAYMLINTERKITEQPVLVE